MKKGICLLLVLLIACGCMGGIAEGKESVFAQIREGVTAGVYAHPGDENAFDTLESGRICGVTEEQAEGGTPWLHVFYADGEKKDRTGYIRAENAERLSQDELTALLEDSDKLNEVLDLVDAVNETMKTRTGSASDRTGAGSSAKGGEGPEAGQDIKLFYEQAMDMLKTVFDSMGQADLSRMNGISGEIGRQVREAGEDLMDQVQAAADRLNDQLDGPLDLLKDMDLTEKLEEIETKMKEIDLDSTLDELTARMETLDPEGSISDLAGQLDSSALREKVESVRSTVDALMHGDSALGQEISRVISELKDLFNVE